MAWFLFRQNNSGGYFKVDDVLCHELLIEADSANDANRKFLDWGGYFDGVSSGFDCGCCGDRWSESSEAMEFPINYIDGKSLENAEEYARYQVSEWGHLFKKIYRIFYSNGKTLQIKSLGKKGKVEEGWIA